MSEVRGEYDVAIIGAGIAGLHAASTLRRLRSDLRIAVFEASTRAGGAIATERVDGYVIEEGPESILAEKPEVLEWIESLGLRDEIITTATENRGAYVVKDGRLIRIPLGFRLLGPSSMAALATSRVLSLRGLARVAAEPFVRARVWEGDEEGDESLASFVSRRFGRELLDRLVQPLAGGIYGADPSVLSMRATFPRFLDLERDFGSVIRGLRNEEASRRRVDRQPQRRTQEASGARYGLFISLRRGLGTLVETLEQRVGDALRTCAPVERLLYDEQRARWTLHVRHGNVSGASRELAHYDARAVLLALPAKNAAPLLAGPCETLSRVLGQLQYGSSAIVTYAWRTADIPRRLDAFGFVAPARERPVVMASTWSSVKYPGRAPEGHALIRAYVGGFANETLCTLPDDELDARVRTELRTLLGVSSAPLLRRVHRYVRAMPVYGLGHLAWRERVRLDVAKTRGLALAGTAYDGVGIPAVVANASKAVDELLHFLSTDSSASS